MSDNKIQVSINGDNIEIRDDTYQYVSIPIDQWQEIKDAVDAKLHGKYHHLREIIKNTDPIKLD
ncbi:hypothetical protein [Psychrobacter sp. 1044]|uniref:hypothetical protein n=1 Tax=Psychrobacter sp. 1044 TaxID=2772562 RepID=UPI001918841F|nr:hypothetical protein [Psychrobacter sp. 1044]